MKSAVTTSASIVGVCASMSGKGPCPSEGHRPPQTRVVSAFSKKPPEAARKGSGRRTKESHSLSIESPAPASMTWQGFEDAVWVAYWIVFGGFFIAFIFWAANR